MYGPHFGPPPPHYGPHFGPPPPHYGPHFGPPPPYGRHPHDPVVCCCTIF